MQFLSIVWNPPEGIDLGFFVIRYYSLTYVVAFTIGYYIMKRFFKNENVPLQKLDSLFIYMVLAVLIGARLGHVIFYEPELIARDPISVILPIKTKPFEFTGFTGLASHGAAIGIIIALIIYYRKKIIDKPLLWLFDRIIITVAIGGAFVRFGNFMNSEIVGKPSGDSPFGVKFIKNDIGANEAIQKTGIKDAKEAYTAIANNPEYASLLDAVPYRHPTQIYEALGYVVAFIILWYVYWKTDKKQQLGYLFGLFLILLWSVRFVVEFIKEAQVEERADWLLNTGQLLSIPFIILGVYLMMRSSKHKMAE